MSITKTKINLKIVHHVESSEMIKALKVIFFIVLALVLSGCDLSKSVKNDKRFWGGYEVGKRYEVLEDIFALWIRDQDVYALSPSAEFILNSKRYVDFFHSAPFSKEHSNLVLGGTYESSTISMEHLLKGVVIEVTDVRRIKSNSLFFGEAIYVVAIGKVNKPGLTDYEFRLDNLSVTADRIEIDNKKVELTKPNPILLKQLGMSNRENDNN